MANYAIKYKFLMFLYLRGSDLPNVTESQLCREIKQNKSSGYSHNSSGLLNVSVRSTQIAILFSAFRLPFSFLQGHPLLTKFPHPEGQLAIFLQKRPLFALDSVLLIEWRYLFLKEPMHVPV